VPEVLPWLRFLKVLEGKPSAMGDYIPEIIPVILPWLQFPATAAVSLLSTPRNCAARRPAVGRFARPVLSRGMHEGHKAISQNERWL